MDRSDKAIKDPAFEEWFEEWFDDDLSEYLKYFPIVLTKVSDK